MPVPDPMSFVFPQRTNPRLPPPPSLDHLGGVYHRADGVGRSRAPRRRRWWNDSAGREQQRIGAPEGVALTDSVNHVLVDALSCEGAITAAHIDALPTTASLVEGPALSASVVDSDNGDGSLIRSPDGTETGNADADWVFTAAPTPGAANSP